MEIRIFHLSDLASWRSYIIYIRLLVDDLLSQRCGDVVLGVAVLRFHRAIHLALLKTNIHSLYFNVTILVLLRTKRDQNLQ